MLGVFAPLGFVLPRVSGVPGTDVRLLPIKAALLLLLMLSRGVLVALPGAKCVAFRGGLASAIWKVPLPSFP